VTPTVEAAVAKAFHEEWGQIVATLIRVTGDWDLAEESARDAFALALQRWPRDGIPRRPGAWLTTAARHRATDRLRREAVGATKLWELAMLRGPDEHGDDEVVESGVRDDRLRLMFTCCHPALAFESQVALTLRTLAGLTTAEIGRAFPGPGANDVTALGPGQTEDPPRRYPVSGAAGPPAPERTAAVLGVLYLLFNEATPPARARPGAAA
jgi:RNA polymerase sigma-70 factor (ECF subfamily)